MAFYYDKKELGKMGKTMWEIFQKWVKAPIGGVVKQPIKEDKIPEGFDVKTYTKIKE